MSKVELSGRIDTQPGGFADEEIAFTETQIVAILKEADAGVLVKDICRKHGISDATDYNWKSKYGAWKRLISSA